MDDADADDAREVAILILSFLSVVVARVSDHACQESRAGAWEEVALHNEAPAGYARRH